MSSPSRKSRKGIKRWSESEDLIVRQWYSTRTTKEIQALLPDRTEEAITQRAMGFGIKKNPEHRSTTSRRSFLALCERLGVKPGQQPRPVGSMHKKGRYTMVKIAQPDVWKPLHIHTWELAHGPVPEGMQIWAKDGNPRNVALENLCLTTLAEIHLRTNPNYRGLPDEVLDILHLQNEIRKTIKRKRRNEK